MNSPSTERSQEIPARKKKRILSHVVRWTIAAVVIGFLGLAARRAWNEFESKGNEIEWGQVSIGNLTVGVVLCMMAMVPACIAWIQTLRSFQQQVSTVVGYRAYFLGHLGKYVPGKAMAIILRISQLHQHGVLVRPAMVSVFIETLTSIATGSILGAVLLLQMSPPRWLAVAAWIGLPFALVSLVPNLFRAIVSRISKSRVGHMPESVADAITWRLMLRTCAWSTLGWLLHGTSLWFFLAAIDRDPALLSPWAWLVCTTSICMGALAGFLSMLPGGAGVREIVAMMLLSTLVSEPVALTVAIVSRLGTIVAEVLMVVITTAWLWYAQRTTLNRTR